MDPTHVIMRTAATAAERARLGRDARGDIEEIRVRSARAVEIDGDHGSVTPAAGIDIGGGKLLLVAGQWLDDPELYDSAPPVAEDADGLFGAVFPCEAFTLRRHPASGEILSIRTEGAPIELGPAIQGVELTARRPTGSASWFLEGTLEQLPALLGAPAQRPSSTHRTTSGLFYAGTREEVRLGDRVRIRRWLRRDLEGVVSYIPGLSRFDRSIGTDQWVIRLDAGYELVVVYAPEQVQPAKRLVLVERARE